MLSAVENHFGPSRPYATAAHHYSNGSSNNSGTGASASNNNNNNLIATPCPIVALPTAAVAMSAAEFARPHPKTTNRYNGSQSLRNGLTSSRTKYSQMDQSGPVNLAVSTQISSSLSDGNSPPVGILPMNHAKQSSDAVGLTSSTKISTLESEQDAIHNSIASLYQHKLAYCSPAPEATAAYYSNFYGRSTAGSVYGAPLYGPPPPSSHALGNSRNQLHHGCATYPHVDAYSNPYLFAAPPATYSPPAPARPGLSPQSPIGTITVGSTVAATALQSNNNSISAQSVLPNERLSSTSSSTSTSSLSSPSSTSPPSIYTQQQHQQQQQHHHQQQQQQQHQQQQHQQQQQQQHQQQHQQQQHQQQQHQQQQHQQQHQQQQHQHQQQHQQQQHQQQQHQQYLQSQNVHNQPAAPKIANSYRSDAKESKSNHQNGKSSDFKIPSGKEGSLKHRILTRPYGDKDSTTKHNQQRSTSIVISSNNNATKSSLKATNNNSVSSKNKNNNINNNNNNHATNFNKGTLIELSTGEFKRVEDMRAEDFVTSSNKNSHFQLIDATVVKITIKSKNNVVITLSYNNIKTDMENQSTHPYFVYGKGWAACDPDGTFNEYSLKCQLLEVGDVCISLRPRDTSLTASKQIKSPPGHHQVSFGQVPAQYYPQPHMNTNYTAAESVGISPQNLSRKQMPYTVSTTSTATAVTSRPIPAFELPSSSYNHQMSAAHNQLMQQHQRLQMSAAAAAASAPPPPPNMHLMADPNNKMRSIFSRDLSQFDDRRNQTIIPLQRALSHENSSRKYNLLSPMAPPPPPPPATTSADGTLDRHQSNSPNDEAIDATTYSSRKRRWSAPDNNCDVDGCQMEQKKCTKH